MTSPSFVLPGAEPLIGARTFAPDCCANCLAPLPQRVLGLFCSEWCRQIADTVRYWRGIRRDGRDAQPDVRLALNTRIAHLLAGGYRSRDRRLPEAVRRSVWKRDRGQCRSCGAAGAEIDHIDSDSPDPANLQVLCPRCHHAKTGERMRPASTGQNAQIDALLRQRVRPEVPALLADDRERWKDVESRLRRERKQRLLAELGEIGWDVTCYPRRHTPAGWAEMWDDVEDSQADANDDHEARGIDDDSGYGPDSYCEPGSPWGYTSGTEEELFTGLLELGETERPMRDVWVAFLDHPSPVEQIVKLRDQMSHHHSMMYETIADVRGLKAKLTDRLETWEALAGSKVAQHIDLLPSSGKDVLRSANLRLRGEKLVELGQAEAGGSALKEAAVLGGPAEHLAYARFLARHGDLDEAYALTQRAIDYFSHGQSSLYSPLAAEAFAAQAGVLRQQGRDVDAIGRLEQALTLLNEQDAYAQKVRCRILDELGLARQKTGDNASARRDFEAALKSRRDSHQDLEVGQSLVNLVRLEVHEGDLTTAASHAEEAIRILRGAPPTALHANAEVLVAQVALRQGRPNDGVPHAERALSSNQRIASRRGEAISLLLLAQCCRAAGRTNEAKEHAHACLAVNRAMGNEGGAQRAQWILDQLAE